MPALDGESQYGGSQLSSNKLTDRDMANDSNNEKDVKRGEIFAGASGSNISYGVDDGDNEPRLKICMVEKDA